MQCIADGVFCVDEVFAKNCAKLLVLRRPSKLECTTPTTTTMHQCVNVWEGRSPHPQVMTGKELFCSKEFRC